MSLPQEVLYESVNEAVGTRSVEHAVFTTFSFDPGFFERHILPCIFPNRRFSSSENVRLIQLEDELRTNCNLEVYFDAQALASDAVTPKLAYRRIPISWKRGVFHPKLVLLLVRQPEDKHRSLIVCCQSANLTRSGWWENVECVQIEELFDFRTDEGKQGYAFRNDLLSILNRVRNSHSSQEDYSLQEIRKFLLNRVNPNSNAETNRVYPRFYGGYKSKSFRDWLQEVIPAQFRNEKLNMEVISPYFDKRTIAPLENLIETLVPIQTRVYLPKEDDATIRVSEDVYNAVQAYSNVEWARLPGNYANRRGSDSSLASRFVHAKIIRLWHRNRDRPNLFIIGSVNCTSAAQGPYGNMECAILVDVTRDQAYKRAWFLNCDDDLDEVSFHDKIPEEFDEFERPKGEIRIQFDWSNNSLQIIAGPKTSKNFQLLPVQIKTAVDEDIVSVEGWYNGRWIADEAQSAKFRKKIEVSSLVRIQTPLGGWIVLVEETGFAFRPSLIRTLSPSEILQYWSLLSPEQKKVFLERNMQNELVEGLPISTRTASNDVTDTVFSQYAGVFHGFGQFRRHLMACAKDNQNQELEALMFGQKHDSLPVLLEQTLNGMNAEDKPIEPINVYITFLTAKQLKNELIESEEILTGFFNDRKPHVEDLDRLINKGICESKEKITENFDQPRFISWFEAMFLRRA